MNFLGHFYLSQHDAELVVGNFIADFVKGKKYLDYPPAIAEGIRMHREIDFYTDSHVMVKKGRTRLFEYYRHYSGVIMDMYYDHYLAAFWEQYSRVSLEKFSEQIYEVIAEYKELLPEKSRFMFPYMRRDNWLLRYATTEGIDRSLTGMARRLDNGSKLEQAIAQLHEYYDEYAAEFQSFMSDIEAHIGNSAWGANGSSQMYQGPKSPPPAN